MAMSEDGVLASAPQVKARTLEDFERAITVLLDDMADLVPDSGAEDEAAKAKREALEMQLTDLFSREADKVDRIADVLRRFAFAADECATEADRMRKRSKAFENKHKRFASYILDVMLRWGAKKLEGTKSTLTRIQNADTVDVDDAKVLPFAFQRFEFTFVPTTQEQATALHDMLSVYAGNVSIEPNKRALLDAVKSTEANAERGIMTGDVAQHEPLPDGVRLKPGTWRLAVR